MFSDRLHEARSARGLSQRELADAACKADPSVVGIDHSRISNWETGQRPMPSLPKLLALSEALGVEHLWLAGLADEGGPTSEQDAA